VRYLLVTNLFYVCPLNGRCNEVDAEHIVLCLQNAILLVSSMVVRVLYSKISVVKSDVQRVVHPNVFL